MFPFSDPSGTGVLEQENALEAYRDSVLTFDQFFGLLAQSAYVERDAFLELAAGVQPSTHTVDWRAFPITATVSDEEIDRDRFGRQDEYVEWRVEKGAGGAVTRVTFTMEFPEYFEALAQVGVPSLLRGIQDVIPGANPTNEELFGPGFNPATATPRNRASRFRNHLQSNPWNNGSKGILCLTQQFNTMSALFNLVGRCAVPRPNLDPSDVCGAVGGACGPQRNSDPSICQNCQVLAIGERGLSLDDPVGIRVLELRGIWEVNGQSVDINDPQANGGAWTVSRNGRRAVLEVTQGVTLGGNPIVTGAQVAAVLQVAADVISAPQSALPEWARTGNEGTRNS